MHLIGTLSSVSLTAATGLSYFHRLLMSNTRNSAVADKPRDAFVQMQFGADDLPPKHVPLHMCYHAEFGRSTSKDVDISRRIPKHGERGAPPLGMGRG